MKERAETMEKTQILIVEDESIVARDIQKTLQNVGYDVLPAVSSGEAAIQKAEETKPDLVLMDIILKGEMDGIEAAEQIRSRFNIPVVYLTAYTDEKLVERAKITEPFGYVVKPFGDRELTTVIEVAIYKAKIENKLKESQEWLSTTLRSIGDAVIATDAKGCVKFMNSVAESLTGWDRAEAIGKPVKDIFNIVNEETHKEVENPVAKVIREGVVVGLANHTILIAKDGREIFIDYNAAPIRDNKGKILGVILVILDITERKKAEEELRHEKEFLNNIINSLTHPFYVINADDYKIEMANSAACPHTLAEDATCYYLTHNRDKPCAGKHVCPLKEVKETKKRVTVEHIHYDGNGNARYFEVHGYPVLDKKGKVVRMIEYSFDITERKKNEQALRESEKRFRGIFDTASHGMALISTEGHFMLFNDRSVEMLGYSRGEIASKTVFEITHPEDVEVSRRNIKMLFDGETDSYRIENRYIKKDGSILWADFSARSIYDPKSRVVAMLGILVDITDRKKAEEDLKRMEKIKEEERRLRELDKMKDEFLNLATHELKTPLTPIKAQTELWAKGVYGKLNEKQVRSHKIIRRNTIRLIHLIDDLMTISKIDSRRLQFNMTEVDLRELIRDAYSDMEMQAKQKNLKFEADIPDNLPTVYGDWNRITQVLVDLINNAIKFTEEGGISIKARPQGDEVIVSIKDTGVGIPPDKIDKIFDEFYQVDHSITRKYGGTGIGLTIVKAIIEKHNGEVWVEGTPDKGSTFHFTLPVSNPGRRKA